MSDLADRVTDVAKRYTHGHDRPLGPYGVLDVVYVGLVGMIAIFARRRPVPDLSVKDVVLVGVATHRVARTMAKDPVTSPIRMPFTRYEGVAAPAELEEKVVGTGMGRALGELVTCPFCLAQWVATGFTAGMIFSPRITRMLATTFAGVTVSDFLQYAYAGVQSSDQSD